MNYEELKNKYPLVRDIQSQKQAEKWLPLLTPEEQKVLELEWNIQPKATNERENKNEDKNSEDKNKEEKGEKEDGHGGGHGGFNVNAGEEKKEGELKKDSDKKDQSPESDDEVPPSYDEAVKDSPPPYKTESQNKLKEYKSLEEKPPKEIEEADEFLKEHEKDNIPAEEVEKYKKQTGQELGFKEVRSAPPINRITAIISSIKEAPKKIKEYLGLHQLNDEALPNIQAEEEKIRKKISKKWELIQEQFPETKDLKNEEEFKNWASKLSEEQKKSLYEKWGNSTIFPESAFAYKKESEQESLSQKTPILIFKLPTKLFHPKPSTSAITKEGKTDQEYEKQFNELSAPEQKSILHNDIKNAKQKAKKTEKKEKDKNKPTSYRERFKKMYGYLQDLKNTPKKYAAKDVANQEYNKSQKNYNPIQAAVVVQELEEFDPPPPYDPPPSYQDVESKIEATPKKPTKYSRFRQQVRNMPNNYQNTFPNSKYREAARKLRKKGKKATAKGLAKSAAKKGGKKGGKGILRMILNPRGCLMGISCLILLTTLFIMMIVVISIVGVIF